MVRHFTAWNHEEAKGPLSQTTPSPHRFRHSLCLPLQPRAVDIPTVLCSTLHQHLSTVGQIVSSFASQQAVVCSGVDTVTSLHWTGNRASPLPENRFSVSRQKKKTPTNQKNPYNSSAFFCHSFHFSQHNYTSSGYSLFPCQGYNSLPWINDAGRPPLFIGSYLTVSAEQQGTAQCLLMQWLAPCQE